MNRLALVEFVDRLLRTRAFQRLKDVSFLGIVDRYSKSLSNRYVAYSRADHSIGVLSLSLKIASQLQMTHTDAMIMAATALTHDLAHPAFSHSLEYAFDPAERSVDHHSALREYLLGRIRHFRDVRDLLDEYRIDVDRIYSVVSGTDDLSFFFMSPLNVDTLDGISRSLWSVGAMAPYNVDVLVRSLARLYRGDTITSPSFFKEADRFWTEKDGFYSRFLSGARRSTERSFQQQVRKSIKSLDFSFFEMSDTDFVRLYPEIIYHTATDDGADAAPPSQRFEVDTTVSPVDRSSVYLRYRRIRRADRAAS